MRTRPLTITAHRYHTSAPSYTAPLSDWQRDRASAPFEREPSYMVAVIRSIGWPLMLNAIAGAVVLTFSLVLWSIVL